MNTKEFQILMVDDNPANITLLEMLLEENGFDVQTAIDGKEALEKVATNPPDLILLDILMPGIDGYEVCQKLKADDSTKHIPVIFLSALQDVKDRMKGFEVGGVDFINKPFHAMEVLSRVNIHLTLRQQQVELERLNNHISLQIAQRTAQLNHVNHRMAAILANVTDAIILINVDGTIDMTNNSFSVLFGYAPDELFHRPITEIVEPAYHGVIAEMFEQAKRGDPQTHIQVEAVRKDKSTFDMDLSFALISGNINQIVCSCHDISELKAVERMKDNFVSTVTHELRTPITGILLLSNQIYQYRQRMSEEQLERKIKQLNTQSKLMADLVESILDISRLEMHKKLSDEVVNMLEIVQGIVTEMTPMADEKQQSLVLKSEPVAGVIRGNRVDFERLWRNLVGNAIKYTPDGGTIVVRTATIHIQNGKVNKRTSTLQNWHWNTKFELELMEGVYFVGQVEDDGIGISAENLPFVYDRFHRGQAQQSNIPGTGLGLALVKELLTLYKGTIHIDSEIGKGTLVTFWIPFEKEQTQ